MKHSLLSIAIALLLSFWCCSDFLAAQMMSNAQSSAHAQASVQTMSKHLSNCPNLYQRYSTKHSFCQPQNQSCNIIRSKLTPKEINQVLELHNSFRSVIATQKDETNGVPNELPAAADMLLMEWDDELAKIAQEYSNQCLFEHDKPSQRRVRNFGCGQNIAIQSLTGLNVQPPIPDWHFAVSNWMEEIVFFSSDMVCNFGKPQPNQGEYRHFTQLVWSRTFRVGCGYTLYKHGNTYNRLYICNYGPAGNGYKSCVYEKGKACSKCPVNTKCITGTQNPGLCQRINNEAPYQPIKQPHLFYCNFMSPNTPDCQININGPSSWYVIQALGGNYLETVVHPGQKSTIQFSKHIDGSPNSKSICVQIVYRKGPNSANDLQNNDAKEIFVIPVMNGYTYVQNLPTYEDEDTRHEFSTFNLTLQWHESTEMKISFTVPSGAAPQFLNIGSILATDNDCQN